MSGTVIIKFDKTEIKDTDSVRVCLTLRDPDVANKDKWEAFNMYGLSKNSWTSKYTYPLASAKVADFCNVALPHVVTVPTA